MTCCSQAMLYLRGPRMVDLVRDRVGDGRRPDLSRVPGWVAARVQRQRQCGLLARSGAHEERRGGPLEVLPEEPLQHRRALARRVEGHAEARAPSRVRLVSVRWIQVGYVADDVVQSEPEVEGQLLQGPLVLHVERRPLVVGRLVVAVAHAVARHAAIHVGVVAGRTVGLVLRPDVAPLDLESELERVVAERFGVLRHRDVRLVPAAVGVVETAAAAGVDAAEAAVGVSLAIVPVRLRVLGVEVVVAPVPVSLRLEERARAEDLAVLDVPDGLGRVLPAPSARQVVCDAGQMSAVRPVTL